MGFVPYFWVLYYNIEKIHHLQMRFKELEDRFSLMEVVADMKHIHEDNGF